MALATCHIAELVARCSNSSMAWGSSKVFGDKNYKVPAATDQIQMEIMTEGPVIASMLLYTDFLRYNRVRTPRSHCRPCRTVIVRVSTGTSLAICSVRSLSRSLDGVWREAYPTGAVSQAGDQDGATTESSRSCSVTAELSRTSWPRRQECRTRDRISAWKIVYRSLRIRHISLMRSPSSYESSSFGCSPLIT